jgi:hypothetical protein
VTLSEESGCSTRIRNPCFGAVPVCPALGRDQHELVAQTIEGNRRPSPGHGLSSDDAWQKIYTPILNCHRGNRSSEDIPQQPQLRLALQGAGNCPGKGGGRHRGGEWRPRARSGPGGGGRLRPYVSLTAKCPRMRPPVSVSQPRWRIRHRYPLQRQPNRITTYADRSEKGLSLTSLPCGRSFFMP